MTATVGGLLVLVGLQAIDILFIAGCGTGLHQRYVPCVRNTDDLHDAKL